MLDQVIYNLLNNAAVHTASTSGINISVTCHADLLNIIVEDAGAGFRDVGIKDVFDKFSRSKDPKTARPGLGLSIIKGFTEAMSGTVELEKAVPQGSRFIISIPVKTTLMKPEEV